MLSNILAVLVGVGSFLLYMAAFFFPEVHRKGDFFWSGIGMFYALVLWFCAGRMTGAVLLGQTATVAFMGWFAWQTLLLRREVTPARQRTEVSDKVIEKSGGFGLFKGKPKDKPVSVAGSTTAPVTIEGSAPQKVVTKSGGFGLFKGKSKDKPVSVASSTPPAVKVEASLPEMESLPSLEDVLVPQKPENVSPATVIQVEEMPVSNVSPATVIQVEEIPAPVEATQAPVEAATPVVPTGETVVPLMEDDDFGFDDVEPVPVSVAKVETKKEPVVAKKKDKKEKENKDKKDNKPQKQKKEKSSKGGGLGAIFAPLMNLFAKKDKKAVEVKPAAVVKAEELTVVEAVKSEELPVVEAVKSEELPVVEAVKAEESPVVEAVIGEVMVEETVVLSDNSVTVTESVTVEFEPVVESSREDTVPELVRPNEPSEELVEAAKAASEKVSVGDVVVEEIAPEVDLAPPAEAFEEASVEVPVEVVEPVAVVLPVEPLAESVPVVSQESEGDVAELSEKREDVARVEVPKRSAQASSVKGVAGDIKDDDDF
ncbi:MAG TPA: Ycf66 family protein [Halomicronema sp.]